MRQTTDHLLLFAILLAPIAPAMASTLDVTTDSMVTLGTGDSLIFTLSASQYPGEIEMLLGGMPIGGPVQSIPGTSGVYMPGILLTGTLESLNGSVSIPFTDPNAVRLDLPTGDMLLTPGSQSGGSYSGPIDLISGEVAVSSQEAAQLFASDEFVIDVQNEGSPITFGYAGSTIAGDFTASLISPDGSQSMGARVMDVECVRAPEPGTIGLLLIGLAMTCGAAISGRSRLSAGQSTGKPNAWRRGGPLYKASERSRARENSRSFSRIRLDSR